MSRRGEQSGGVTSIFSRLLGIISAIVLLGIVGVVVGYLYIHVTVFSGAQPRSVLLIIEDPPIADQTTALFIQPDQQQLSRVEIPESVVDYRLQDALTSFRNSKDSDERRALLQKIQFLFSYDFRQAIDTVYAVDYQTAELIRSQDRLQFAQYAVAHKKPLIQSASLWYVLRLPTVDVSVLSQDQPLFLQPQQLSLDAQAQCTVAMTNSTYVGGLARILASSLETYGVRVLRVEDGEKGQSAQLFVDPDLQETCQDVLLLVQALSPKALTPVIDADKTQEARASIILTLGQEHEEILQPE